MIYYSSIFATTTGSGFTYYYDSDIFCVIFDEFIIHIKIIVTTFCGRDKGFNLYKGNRRPHPRLLPCFLSSMSIVLIIK